MSEPSVEESLLIRDKHLAASPSRIDVGQCLDFQIYRPVYGLKEHLALFRLGY
jgi:hypothetical protein